MEKLIKQNQGKIERSSYRSQLISHHSGITLIALVITIIILLILAGITINLLLADGGIFKKAQDAKIEQRKAEIIEMLNTAEATVSADKLGKPTLTDYKAQILAEGIVYRVEDQDEDTILAITEDGYLIEISIIKGKNVNDIIIGNIGEYEVINNDKVAPQEVTINITSGQQANGKYLLNSQIELQVEGQDSEAGVKAIELYVGNAKVWNNSYGGTSSKITENISFSDLTNLEMSESTFSNDVNIEVRVIDVAGNSSKANVTVTDYTMKNKADLELLASKVNTETSFSNQEITQVTNIDVNKGLYTYTESDNSVTFKEGATQWTAIGTKSNPFKGTYEGNEKTVSGIYINNSLDYQGLFGYSTGTIQNVGINNSSIISNRYCGAVVGWNEAGTVSGCYNTINVQSFSHIGGVVGFNYNGGIIENCYNTGNIVSTGYDATETTLGMVGGIVGANSVTGDNIIRQCYNKGNVTGSYQGIGGIVGINSKKVYNCYNEGKVESSTINTVGGIVGFMRKGGTIEFCYNNGEISNTASANSVGGILGGGSVTTGQNTVNMCYNLGKVYSSNSNAGGIIGTFCGGDKVSNCYNVGEVVGTSNIGGILGIDREKTGTITGNYYLSGTVTVNGTVKDVGIGNVTSSTGVTVKNADFFSGETTNILYILNNNGTTNIWAQESNKNRGNPYLVDNPPKE